MFNEEIVSAICANHVYEYLIVNDAYCVQATSPSIEKYCKDINITSKEISVFDVVPELVGMEDILQEICLGEKESLLIPLVFKEPHAYVNIRVHASCHESTCIVLFENITETTLAQQEARQANNENVLLLREIAKQNKVLEQFNQEMQKMVDAEVAKNLEKQHTIEIQSRHAQMGEMIAMITHQWKQPLSAIHTTGMLLKIKYDLGTLTQDIFNEKMNLLLGQASHMNQTVVDFQTFFTPSKEKVHFNIYETIQAVLALVEVEYHVQNIEIVLNGESEVSVYGYANEYKQVILALLQNAKDAFLSSPKATMQIMIDVHAKKGRSVVSLSDNAGGIPEEIIGDIFTQYVSTKKTGSGLGLHIAKTVIEDNMQGSISVKNKEKGACFKICV